MTFTGYGTTGTPPTYASTVTTTYDPGDRATQIVDSGAGTISRAHDLLDRLTKEVTPEGTVDYTYDSAGRRSTMTVAGQTLVSYTYDDADRLTGVTQGTARPNWVPADLHSDNSWSCGCSATIQTSVVIHMQEGLATTDVRENWSAAGSCLQQNALAETLSPWWA